MARKQTIIIFPHLVNGTKDLSKTWYVEWKYRIPGDPIQRVERVYKGLNEGSYKQRLTLANRIIKEKTEWLKSGEYLTGNNPTRVYADELLYANEAKLFGQMKKHVITCRTHLSDFLGVKKASLKKEKSYKDFQSKLRIFNAWLELNKLDDIGIKNISKMHITLFAKYLAEKDLSRLTIDKYMQCIHAFFEFELEMGAIESNPVNKIEKMGKIVDFSATPFQKNERQMLKDAISVNDPQLWLACQIQYYCAIRPGTELRLMKLSCVDWDNQCFRVSAVDAKNSETELVAIPDFLIKEMKSMNLNLYDKSLFIFGKNGCPGPTPYGKNTLRNRFNRYREALNIPDSFKFYSWKHTGAIDLLYNGAPEHEIQNHLRHKSFATTEMYLKKRAPKTKKITRFTREI